MSVAQRSRRQLLREATAEMHRQLDQCVSSLNLADIDDYRWFLHASARAVIAAELALEHADIESLLPDWPQRKRSALVAADLAQLSMHVSISSLPAWQTSELLGVVYVLEGSRLGGTQLVKLARASNNPSVAAATRYLGAEAPQLWRSFLGVLESSPAAEDLHSLVVGARSAFALFAASFAEMPPRQVRA